MWLWLLKGPFDSHLHDSNKFQSPEDDENQSPYRMEGRERKNSGQKPKFVPVLEPLAESGEIAV